MSNRKSGKKKQETEISDQEMEVYEKAFKKVDKSKKGSIPIEKIMDVIEIFDDDIDQEEIDDILEQMGKRTDDSITFDEFVDFMKEMKNPKNIVDAFTLFDKDKNGYISIDEFRSILQMVNSKFSEEEMKEIFKMTDVSKDGKIDYREFVDFWNSQ